jgi:hypothetical protein
VAPSDQRYRVGEETMMGVGHKAFHCQSAATSAEYALLLAIFGGGIVLATVSLANSIATGINTGRAAIGTAGASSAGGSGNASSGGSNASSGGSNASSGNASSGNASSGNGKK